MKKRSHFNALPPPTTNTSSRSIDTTAVSVVRLLQKKNKKPKITTIVGVTSDVPTFTILDDDDLLKYVFSFVGDHQYRFVGAVNQSFQKAYVTLFPRKVTHLNVSSISLIQLCWDDIKIMFRYDYEEKDKHRHMLWDYAAKYGNKDMVKYLLRLIRSVKHKRTSVCNGIDFRTIQSNERWLVDWRYNLAGKAAEYGHLHLLQWAFDQKVYVSKNDTRVCGCALGSGHMEILHWAVQKGFVWEKQVIDDSVYMAIQKGKLEALEWIHSIGYDFNEYVGNTVLCEASVWCDIAVEFGQFEVLQFLHSVGSEWGDDTIDIAVKHGELEALDYILLDGFREFTDESCNLAAINGNLEALKLLRSVDCPWDDAVPAFAAARGHVHLIEWAINSGCPWSERTCQCAAAYGTLETLKWLRAKGCPWDDQTTKYASTEEIYLWAKDNGCPVAEEWDPHHYGFYSE